ncbi:MAG TPA: hypothetical protein VF680_01485 [Allosphingosinicella sp.]|jgi:hypothetical protein
MAHPHFPHELVEAAQATGSALMPAAIGATVSQAFKRGLSYGERLIQILVGICVSYFAGGAINAIFEPSPLVAQAVTFVFAMVAYEATPKFIHNATEVLGQLPAELRDRFLKKKDDK